MARITYGSLTLAGTPPTDSIASVRVPVAQRVQVAEGVRADYPVLIPRGNRTKAISFTVDRTFSTLLDAEQFVHDHEADLPTSGALVFTLSDGSATRTYADAVLQSCDPLQRGLQVLVTYTFVATESA